MIAIAIKTFIRPCVFTLLDSINQHLPELPVYVVDDSPDIKTTEYNNWREKITLIITPPDIGLSEGRNVLMRAVKEPFILYCDDDYVLGSDNGVYDTLKILKKRPDIGMITGSLTSGKVVTGFESNLGKWEGDIRQTDRGLNFFIARKEMFKDIEWNPAYKINKEHEDFFKRLKKTKWKVYYRPKLKAEHRMQKGSAEYIKYRNRGGQ